MQLKTVGRATRWLDVAAGSLFNYTVDSDGSALGLRLAPNANDVGAISFTHLPRANAKLPALITIRYFANDDVVFVYGDASFVPDQARGILNHDHQNIPAGAFISMPAGSFIRCEASGHLYNVALDTGELSGATIQRSVWTPHWKIVNRFEETIYQQ